jgi:uncharacterized protein (TIGR00725 family)
MRRVVCVIGKGKACPPEVELDAYDVGRVVGERDDLVLVCGGLGGVMDAAARGATDVGGFAVGLIPASPYQPPSSGLSVALRTGLTIPFRNALVGSVAEVGIVLPGSDGTMQEASVMVERDVPIIGYGKHDAWPTSALSCAAWAVDTDALRGLLVAALAPV